MKEEKCANYERDNKILSEMEQNVADFMDKDLENALKISREQLDKYVDEIYFNKSPREIFLMNAHSILDNRKSKTDPIVESVRQKLLDRSKIGLKKYNSSIFDNIDENYIKHLQEELLDGANYCEQVLRLGELTQVIIEILQADQNEMSVGNKIIREYNKLKETK